MDRQGQVRQSAEEPSSFSAVIVPPPQNLTAAGQMDWLGLDHGQPGGTSIFLQMDTCIDAS